MQQQLSRSSSKLPEQVQDLVKMIFDIESMKKTMAEFEVRISTALFINPWLFSVHSVNHASCPCADWLEQDAPWQVVKETDSESIPCSWRITEGTLLVYQLWSYFNAYNLCYLCYMIVLQLRNSFHQKSNQINLKSLYDLVILKSWLSDRNHS